MLLPLISLTLLTFVPQQEPLGEYWGTGEEESKYYRMVDIPLPEELAVEAGSFEVMPDQKRLAIATRRGDIFLVDGAFDENPEPKFHTYASGLDEIFGMAYRDGDFLVTQQTEVTRIRDEDQDGRADHFETLSDKWGFRHYHEFAFGSKPDNDGNIWVALCLSNSYHSKAPFRGWCLKITPEGQTIPVCSGIRSPCGIGTNEHGAMFYAESQGPWNGSCSLKVLTPGGFMGHPVSFNWYELAPELGPAPVVPNSPSRLEIERKRVKELVPYAVVFPYKKMGRSISGFMVDRTGGKFGPFENQIFIADFSLGIIMRATTELVNGVWQGACYPFREGFDTGLLAVQFTPQGDLIAGGTNRGWPVRGPRAYAIQRLDWTGRTPFEIKNVSVTREGFRLAFTKPVDSTIASNPGSYQLKTFTHIYRQGYGSPEVDQSTPNVMGAKVSEDGMQVELTVADRIQGHVHEFHLPEIRSQDDEALLHSSAYYTLNEIPKTDNATNASQIPTEADDSMEVVTFSKPKDAIQLIDDSGSKFIPESNESLWEFSDGVLTASPKWDSVVTPDAYQDFRMHVEFNVNDAGDVPRMRNGNSGVYIQQRYELQILNSFGVPPEEFKTNECGCLYRFKKPDKLVSRPAGEWQSYDILFQAARFEGARKIQNARITVHHNGHLIHDDVELPNKTGAGKQEKNSARPVQLQGHHNQVQFRNAWIQDLSPSVDVPKITVSQKKLPLNGESFQINGNDAFLILPKNNAWNKNSATPWIWYAPTLNGLPAVSEKWMFEHFLKAGVAIAGIDVGESYGSPQGRKLYEEFYRYLTENRQLGTKPCLLARSRGGLMLYSWAAEHPEIVSGIAGIYPVCNIASYPGIERACGAFQLTAEQLTSQLSQHNPIDRLKGLAEAGVPIFHIHGDKDKVVPLDQNSGIVSKRYKEWGGSMDLEVVPGGGHDMWNGWFQSERLVDFALGSLGRSRNQHPVPKSDLWLTTNGAKGPGLGKHIVLVAADQEYRSEQSLPMLARILSEHHGFHCTVLFSVNEAGEVDPTLPAPFKDEAKNRRHNIPGLEHLEQADCLILLTRFMQLPKRQLRQFHRYFDSGKPLIALRTANHGFWGGTKYMKDGEQVSLRELLGGTFMGHHGGWHREATRGILVTENQSHPILNGVSDIWGPSDVYRCHNDEHPFPDDCTALVMGQPLVDLSQDAKPNTQKEPLPIAWTKEWIGNQNKPSRIFHFTMGSAKDFENEGVRRLTINAVYWGLGMAAEIIPDSSVEIVGTYEPLPSGFNYKKIGVKPRKIEYYSPR